MKGDVFFPTTFSPTPPLHIGKSQHESPPSSPSSTPPSTPPFSFSNYSSLSSSGFSSSSPSGVLSASATTGYSSSGSYISSPTTTSQFINSSNQPHQASYSSAPYYLTHSPPSSPKPAPTTLACTNDEDSDTVMAATEFFPISTAESFPIATSESFPISTEEGFPISPPESSFVTFHRSHNPQRLQVEEVEDQVDVEVEEVEVDDNHLHHPMDHDDGGDNPAEEVLDNNNKTSCVNDVDRGQHKVVVVVHDVEEGASDVDEDVEVEEVEVEEDDVEVVEDDGASNANQHHLMHGTETTGHVVHHHTDDADLGPPIFCRRVTLKPRRTLSLSPTPGKLLF